MFMGKRFKTAVLMVVVVFAVFAFACCSSAASDGKKLSVVFVPNIIGIEYYVPMVAGLQEVVEAMGGTFDYVGPSAPSVTEQIPYLKAQIQKGVDYLVFCPTSNDALNETLDEATAAGIKLITMNQDLKDFEQHRLAGVEPTDYTQFAIDSMREMIKGMNYEGDFVVLSANTEAIFQNGQIAVYKEELENNPDYANIKLLEVIYGNDDIEKSLNDTLAAF